MRHASSSRPRFISFAVGLLFFNGLSAAMDRPDEKQSVMDLDLVKSWHLDIVRTRTLTRISPDTGRHQMVVLEVKIGNINDADSTAMGNEIFIRETKTGEKYGLAGMTVDLNYSPITPLFSGGSREEQAIGAGKNKADDLRIGQGTSGLFVKIHQGKNPFSLFLFFEIREMPGGDYRLFFGDSHVKIYWTVI